jgi:uncharacterized protein YndB with AHSA1/START domain
MRARKIASSDVLRTLASVLLLLAALFINGCGTSLSKLNELAASGVIQEDAPVKAELQISIDAPPARVWALLVDAASWPKWEHGIENVNVAGQLASGMRFSWKTGGTEVHSQVQLFEPERRLGWTGTASIAKAVHIWDLEAESPSRTLVTMKESMEGPFMGRIYPSDKLREADQGWLAALKQAAEERQ